MSAVLSEAETKFFASGGSEVDPSLGAAPADEPSATTPAEPAAAPAPAAAAAAPAQPAPAAQPAAAPEAPQQVPLAALHEERRRRAEAEQNARQLQQQFEQLQTAMRQAQEPQAPDPEQDPVGYLAFQNRQLQQQLSEIGQWRQQTEQQRQQAMQYQTFVQQVAQSENAFRAKTPDYDDSVQFAMKLEDARLRAFYPDPAERQRVLQTEAANVLSQAIQRGMDPAAALYQAAKELRAAVGVPAMASAVPAVAPAAPVPAAVAPAQVADAAEKIRKGLAQQTNLAAGGTTPPAEMTPEALASISDPAEFNRQWNKMFKRR